MKVFGRIIVPLIVITLATASTIGLILNSRWGQGTLLYIIVPMLVSVVVYIFMREKSGTGAWARYWRHMLLATIIFLASSALLMEGFLCVLMFMPIYYIIVTITYAVIAGGESNKKPDPNVFRSYVLPGIAIMMISEGLFPFTTIERERTATYITTTHQSIDELKANMAAPFELPSHRHWMLRLFPVPDRISAGTLKAGDVHNLHFTYKRWIWSNFQKGQMDILIAKNDPQHIQTRITNNTSYLSHYMNVEGTDVYFKPLEDGRTEVSLTVKYERLLDPAWYFGPLQQFAAKGSAEYLMENIIIREEVGNER